MQALRLNLSDSEIISELGDLFLCIDQLPQAEALFIRGVDLGLDGFNWKLGNVLELQNEFDKALDAFQKGKNGPNSSWSDKCKDSIEKLKAKIGRI